MRSATHPATNPELLQKPLERWDPVGLLSLMTLNNYWKDAEAKRDFEFRNPSGQQIPAPER